MRGPPRKVGSFFQAGLLRNPPSLMWPSLLRFKISHLSPISRSDYRQKTLGFHSHILSSTPPPLSRAHTHTLQSRSVPRETMLTICSLLATSCCCCCCLVVSVHPSKGQLDKLKTIPSVALYTIVRSCWCVLSGSPENRYGSEYQTRDYERIGTAAASCMWCRKCRAVPLEV